MRSYTKPAVAVLTGLSLAGALAGCSTPAPGDTTTGSGTYTDGTYSASGDYQAPSGTETVEVTITLSDNTITDVEVVGDATDPQAKLHQGEFISGIAGVVVGKNIDSIQVDKVGGSSLTSGGFNSAVDAIKADAEA
jgi:uncharacterized protein with FMN-binding domain